ncbi:HAD-IIA family hydrolase [Halorarum salinum]|uniref:HAD-IIA family hydrolase n=1 Tax=Halorarum salinum TaxID=2743089 RepID=A0A7D5L9I1_9EURY|nr:HAD-IIA family hydrolase [Halobaculum salinum]QLG60875.1 HAD-IIA family hydrolase [Halobaculum salinum]
MSGIEGAVLDLDGTVYRGDALVPGAAAAIETLRERGVDVLFFSNKAIERPAAYREKLERLGVPVPADRVVTSATVTATYVAEHHPGERVFLVGEEPLAEELAAAGVSVGPPADATVVVASMDRSFDYDALSDAMAAMEGADAFYATNPDRTCPVEGGEIPDAAGMIGAVEGVTGRDLDLVLGKPSPVAVEAAMARLGVAPERCLMVGDRLETDVRMGNRAGMRTALVLTGVTDAADLPGGEGAGASGRPGSSTAGYRDRTGTDRGNAPAPDHVLDSLADVPSLL